MTIETSPIAIHGNGNSWIQCPRPRAGARLRLFCFPHAGGGATTYRAWSDALPASLELCPVQLPGREGRLGEPAFRNVFPLVDALAPAIAPFLDMPYAFFGHSMGALIAFELARRLRREHNLLPECVFVSARLAPHIRLKRPPLYDLPEADLIQELGRFNGTQTAVLENAELMKLILPALRCDLALSEDYKYPGGPALECPIVVFAGSKDPEMDEEGVDAWRNHTTHSFAKRIFSGDHFFIISQRPLFLDALSVELQRVIARLDLRTSPAFPRKRFEDRNLGETSKIEIPSPVKRQHD